MADGNKKFFKKIINITLTVVILVLIVWFLDRNREVLGSLRNLRVWDVLLIALLQPVNVTLNALINKLLLDHIGQRIPFWDNMLLQYSNNMLNKIVSEGGAVYRGAYLKARFGIPLSKFVSTIGGGYIMILLTNSILGLLFALLIYILQGMFNIYVFALFLLVILGMTLLLVINPRVKGEKNLIRKVNQVLEGWNEIKGDPRLLARLFMLSVLNTLSNATVVYIAYRGLNTGIALLNTLFYSSIQSLANFINLTPGGLGINEAVLMFSAGVIGLKPDTILLGAVLIRGINLITSVSLGGISYLILNYRLHKALDQ